MLSPVSLSSHTPMFSKTGPWPLAKELNDYFGLPPLTWFDRVGKPPARIDISAQ